MSRQTALHFGVGLAIFSVILMDLAANHLAAAILAISILFYVLVYTVWLKRRTAQNIVIGGAAGAFPPLIGWVAVTGDVSLLPVLLFAIIFLWTPPHFWALSLLRCDDYARAGVPMLPVVSGLDETRKQILVYTLILAPVGITPSLFGFAGPIYGAIAAICGAAMLYLAWRVYRDREGEVAASAARKLFAFSLLYVFVLFAALLADNLLARLGFGFGLAL